MSRTADGHSFLPFGNPFRLIFSRKSHISTKFLALLNDFELMLARSFESLKPNDSSELLGLCWMRRAAESLAEIHTDVKVLITDLQFPLSDWDSRWVDAYLNDSIKLLDICISLSSELARLDRGQLLLQYILHIFDPKSSFPLSDLRKRAGASLHELSMFFDSRSPNLQHGYTILQNLAETLHIDELKNSSKGKVLMRALYGVKVQTIFICSTILAALSGCSKPLIHLHVPERFLWSKAFSELNDIALLEIRNHPSHGNLTFLKELEDVEMCTRRLHAFVCCEEGKLLQESKVSVSERLEPLQKSAGNEEIFSEKLDGDEEGRRLQESVTELGDRAEKLFEGVDVLSNRVDSFFKIVLTGRDALLANLRVADEPR